MTHLMSLEQAMLSGEDYLRVYSPLLLQKASIFKKIFDRHDKCFHHKRCHTVV